MKDRFRQPIWMLPLAMAGLVALIGWFGNARLRHSIETQLKAELAATLDANVTALNIWMTNQTRLAAFLAEEPQVHKLSLAILEKPLGPVIGRGRPPDSPEAEDFGLVRLYRTDKGNDMHLTGEKGIVGTPWFMSPESIKNSARSDPRSDIYAVGALAYFLLTREYVFSGESVMEVYEKQLTQGATPPSRRTSNRISPELEQTILRCLEKDAQSRPQTVRDLQTSLRASPWAADWGPDQRATWWSLNQPQAPAPSAPPSPMPATIRIELSPRD